jgi:hypothetical protein
MSRQLLTASPDTTAATTLNVVGSVSPGVYGAALMLQQVPRRSCGVAQHCGCLPPARETEDWVS